ncbi:PRC-barrel domain-containing protein [Azospirillum rugosum]|uniref:Sporulation protein YlmC with PRC-barrel domain n=1 Tax=Azospirillum rugosum TaxID=416170 RepID=A0ABS4SI54_9PROT|nr:PRC-barrel domain-containing protein [Azospirillum rugosum]MBP2291743.1 sporulation protein YlmC with PRC-barrel domain [Azospirillum rugosum]MDQ0524445.1 sporulation protein YlmC with PRC-barrel domain [Azospirillum rugosum]
MRIVLTVAAALAVGVPALMTAPDAAAQNSVTDKIHEEPTLTTKRDPGAARKNYAENAMARQVEHLIGQKVKDPQGNDVGDLENLLVRPDGKVAAVVVEWGTLAGLGGSTVAVPWRDVELSPDGKRVTVNATRDQLKDQPKYDPDVPAAAGIDPDIKPYR